MDVVSRFLERQWEMREKQKTLQSVMDGPDWPKEDWPLSTKDAKQLGEAEEMIKDALAALDADLQAVGGLAEVASSTSHNPAVVEELAALSKMMSSYGHILDEYVESVKRSKRGHTTMSKGKKYRLPAQKDEHVREGDLSFV